MKKYSRQVVFINTSLPSERIHFLKCRHQLQQLDNDDVYQKGLIDIYAARPKSLVTCYLQILDLELYQSNEENTQEVENLSEENYCHTFSDCGNNLPCQICNNNEKIPSTEQYSN